MSDQWTTPSSVSPTPEAVGPGERAGFWRRLGALLVDLVLVGIATNVISFVIILPGGMDGTARNLTGALVQLGVGAIYFGYLWSSRGQTVGYMAFALRVVRSGGGELTLGVAVIRAIALLLSFQLAFVPALISALLVVFGSRHQALHDLLTDSHVVRG
jgi:uncharacterized RDD family membrane protein YckC